MKIPPRTIDAFVKKPDAKARAILVYGPDAGLMRERATALGLSVVADINDPFNVAAFTASALLEDPARLNDEASAISMMGGGRLVRVTEASDKITPLVKSYLENPAPSALVVLEAGELGPKSSLRKLCETSPAAAAIPCYVEDERDLSRLIREMMQAEKLQLDPDALAWLAANISGDRLKVRSEIEKLITYKGEETSSISLTDAQAACGESGARSLDDLVYSVGGRQGAKAISVYGQLMLEGVSFIAVLRALQNHFRRLHVTRARLEDGMNPDEAMNYLNPKIFYKYETAFRTQLENWSLPGIDRAQGRLMEVEALCKTTGAPAETLCAQAVLSISSMRG